MKLTGINVRKLNELVFERRNKNYGAYAIRSDYNNSVLKSLMILSSFVLLLFIGVVVNNKYNNTFQREQFITFDDPTIEPLEYTTEVNLTPITQPKIQSVTAAAPKGGLATRIVDDAVITTSTNIDNPLGGQGTEDSKGTSLTSTVVSTNTVEASSDIKHIKIQPEVFVVVEEMPEFSSDVNGLMKYVAGNVLYPEIAKEIGITGTVYVSFVVNEVGIVENVSVIKGIGYGCDEEVMRVVNKMPRWKKAGKNSGKAVKVRFNIPVSFKLK